ncbi:hypothetical protein B0F90DRAFT_1822679 [Multifurca ochricompacta]|uniref:Uncharacterized protein n=1 Tax=Multifurca ochricompacta TaxID=376703 RepID=A0AAD4QIL1_9AGAM|nr:hypothetical protein B0F90DRAFT_1822679 [Multifurca ochricompacta]
MQENSENLNDDEYYTHSSLATFSFGAASVHRHSYDRDVPSPLSVQATSESGHSHSTGSTDRTPRPSISHTRGTDDEGDEDDARRNRAKMRAIDDGGRRPSLPTNRYIPDRSTAENLPGPSSRRFPEAPGSDSDPVTSGSASDAEIDPGNESGIVDTDVELEGIAPDDASQNTFGLDQVRSQYAFDSGVESDGDGPPGTQQCADWYIVDPNERRQEAGSPVIFASADSDDDDSDVSETGSRGFAAMRRNSVAIRMASARDRSFHASDTDLMLMQANAREREDSVTTVRRPSYGDFESSFHSSITSPNREQQPPLPPANWSMFANNAGVPQADDSGEHVYQGIDLNYIMNVGSVAGPGSRRSSHSFIAPQSLPLPPSKDKGKSKDKRKKDKDKDQGKEHLGVAAMRDLLSQPNRVPNLLDVAPWTEPDDIPAPRRPSTVTLDDSFAGVSGILIPIMLSVAMTGPSFASASASLLLLASQTATQEFGISGAVHKSDRSAWNEPVYPLVPDPDKPNQQRLNAEHDLDTDSVNQFGGPTTVVHRHSRALAFSIYRHYSLKSYRSSKTRSSTTTTVSSRTARPGEGRGTLMMPTHDGILLATKRVQEQFTFTKSTSKLDTHGLLPEEGDNRRDGRREPNLSHPRRAAQDWSAGSPHRESPASRQIVDLNRIEALERQTSSAIRRGGSSHTIGTTSLDLSGTTAFTLSSSTSQSVSSTSSVSTSSASSSISERQLTPHNEAEEDSDGEFTSPVPRTSHPEAFGTLDNFAIDQLKNEQVPARATRRTHGNWIQRIIGPPGGSLPRPFSSSLVSINPPWMTLAPRSMQEEQDRAIQGLRSSFKDVGLVPSSRSKNGAGIGRKGRGINKDMLTQVPDESLYMLLPLWPHETDPANAAREQGQRSTKGLDREQNLYLLVYYVPFDERGEVKPAKKRSRSRPRKSDRERHHPTPHFDVRRGFKVIGRLLAHSDLNGSGIRLPVRGLSVTGPLEEAELGIPPASLRDVHSDDFVIGASLDRSGAIEFVPEGLEKLGLCVPRSEPPVQLHTHPAMQTTDPVEEEVVSQPLTAIGRAAVEIAWLGCMALTTFYGPQNQDQA